MPLSPTPRLLTLAFAGLGVTVALVGCTAPATGGSSDSGASAGTDPGLNTSADTSAEYADGDYTAEGNYVSPAGPSKVTVELTLAGDIVTSVTVTPLATEGNSIGFQSLFAEGIAAVVEGHDIDTLDVARVGGSSLTSGGFNDAIEKIKAEALGS